LEVINETYLGSSCNGIHTDVRLQHFIDGNSSGSDNVSGTGYQPSPDRASASD
jgi:hypothetical protein